ncbi:hypothetical protein BFS06_14250 [Clostridium perfringens]|uniref:hypothetical protein n=1 Tax=Clostridium perfringens TaxID=1502 RepID=UPI0010390529|nr:hypothetical protein [Clostridium perfringens]TBX14367.1 hypothetical protein BFS06_14250 [Clostridium perfringens]
MKTIESELFKEKGLVNGSYLYEGIDIPYNFMIKENYLGCRICIKDEFINDKYIPNIIEKHVQWTVPVVGSFEIKPIHTIEYQYLTLEEAEKIHKGYELAIKTIKELNRIILPYQGKIR